MPEELKVRIMVVSGTVLQSTLLDSPQGSSLDTETAACLQWCPKERDGSRTDSDGVLVDGGHCSLPDRQRAVCQLVYFSFSFCTSFSGHLGKAERGWRGGSAGKALAVQAWGPKIEPHRCM